MPGQTYEPNSSKHKSLSPLEEGIQLAQRNERDAARVILRRVIQTKPESEEAWLWLAWVADDKEGCLRLLRQARQILPNSARVIEAIAAVEGVAATRQTVTEVVTADPPKPKTAKRLAGTAKARPTRSTPKPALAKPAPKQPNQHNPATPPTEPIAPTKKTRHWLWPAAGIFTLGMAAIMVAVGIIGVVVKTRMPVVQAFVLPTAVTNATPTASSQELTAPLYTQVDSAWAAQDWTLAIDLLDSIRLITPDSDRARLLLAKAHYERGNQALNANELDQAKVDLDEAIRLDASDLQVHETRRALTLYLDGVRAYSLQDWDEVVRCLGKVQKMSAGFRDTEPMLAQGYFGVACTLSDKLEWAAAQQSLEAALQLRSDFPEAQQALVEVKDAITPPRRVEVSLTEHLVKVYENHQVVRIFPMCDGKKGSPTRSGRFQVLDKLPLALANQWGGLQMPWWIGLYYTNDDPVNGIENGFHALPFRADQQVMWANSLGGDCSYGCLVLDTQDAIWLYGWVEIGTVVFVNE